MKYKMCKAKMSTIYILQRDQVANPCTNSVYDYTTKLRLNIFDSIGLRHGPHTRSNKASPRPPRYGGRQCNVFEAVDGTTRGAEA